MGRKGVSKRKPKKNNSGSNDNVHHGASSARPGQSPLSVQSLVTANASTGSNKKNRKGK